MLSDYILKLDNLSRAEYEEKRKIKRGDLRLTDPYLTKQNKWIGLFYMHYSTDRIAHTTTFVKPVVYHWLEREIAQRVHHVRTEG